MSAQAPELELPKLDKEDLKAVRSFLPGKLLGRTAALLSLALIVLSFAIALNARLRQFLNIELGLWTYGILIGAFLQSVAQVVLAWCADRNCRMLQALAIKPVTEQTDYFRIHSYLNTALERANLRLPD